MGNGNAIDSILDHVLVLENTNRPTSMEIAKYYRQMRGVKKVFAIRCPDSAVDVANETLDFSTFQETIGKPLWDYLANEPTIDYIVLNKGIPIRLSDAPVGFPPGRPSLDSCVAALDYFHDSQNCEHQSNRSSGRFAIGQFVRAK